MEARSLAAQENFLITEYNRLWDQIPVSEQSQDSATRFFLLLVGGVAGVATILSRVGGPEESISSTAAFQALGAVGMFLGAIGILTGVYVARSYLYRVELLWHLGNIRAYFKKSGPMNLKDAISLPAPGGPSFFPAPWTGGATRHSIVVVVTALSLFLGVYGFSLAEELRVAVRSSDGLPPPEWWHWLVLGVLVVLQIASFYALSFFYRARYKNMADDSKTGGKLANAQRD